MLKIDLLIYACLQWSKKHAVAWQIYTVDYPAVTSGQAVCGSCWLGARDQEAVVAASAGEPEKQVRGGSFGHHPAVCVRE